MDILVEMCKKSMFVLHVEFRLKRQIFASRDILFRRYVHCIVDKMYLAQQPWPCTSTFLNFKGKNEGVWTSKRLKSINAG